MDVKDFREKVNIDSVLLIGGQRYRIEELVKFELDDGSYYLKLYLNDNFVFADDEYENMYFLVKPVENNIEQPFPQKLKFDDKEFDFLFEAHAVAKDVYGDEKHFPKNNSERFWDYQTKDGNYLSLGINDQTKKRVDFYGKIIKPISLKLE
jgi:hypothetical protein